MRTLREGMRGPDVRRWQALLVAKGYLRGRPDGIFGPLTRDATIAFQTAHQLAPDGVVGPRTRAAAGLVATPPAPLPAVSSAGGLVDENVLRRIMPRLDPARCARLAPCLRQAMAEFAIDTPERAAAFLAQLAHESGQFRFMEEIWGPTPAQRRYEPFTSLARMLGNVQPGDGKRFKGRGPIQLTGRANYKRFGDVLGIDLIASPALAATPEVGFRVAGLYWKVRGLNPLADQHKFRQITRRINGGFNGLDDRVRYWERAKQVLGVPLRPTFARRSPRPDEAAVDPNEWRRWTRGLDGPGQTTPTAAERSATRPAAKQAARKGARKGARKTARKTVRKATRKAAMPAAKKPRRTAAKPATKRAARVEAARRTPATPARKNVARRTTTAPARKRTPARRR